MAEIIFSSIADYLGTCQSNDAKIIAIDAIIDSMLTAAATAAESGHLDEYQYDDGHVKIRTKYRSVSQIVTAINSFNQLKQLYINRKTGRMIKLMDDKNFMNNNTNCR